MFCDNENKYQKELLEKYDPNNIHKGYWKYSEFAFKKWKEEIEKG